MTRRLSSDSVDRRLLKKATKEELIEELKKYSVVNVIPPRKKATSDFILILQKSCDELADCQLTDRTWRLFWFLLSIIDWENWTEFSHQAVAERFGVSRVQISKLVKILVLNNLLIVDSRGYNKRAYRLNPFICWKGAVSGLNTFSKEHWKTKRKS